MKRGAMQHRIQEDIDALRAHSQYRSLQTIPDLNLCSNDYLGLSTDPRLKQAVMEAVQASVAVGSTGARLLSGNSREWDDLESRFAEFAGTPASLYFGSGYAANLGLLASLLKPGDVVFSDALNHASLIDGIRLTGAKRVIYPHCDLDFLEKALAETAASAGARVIVTESVFSMEGDIAPLQQILDLAQRFGAELIVDEAHAVGVRGPRGRGVAAALGIEDQVLATIYTCGKALASAGAFVCGQALLRDHLINRARTFIFSTAMPPYLAGQIRAALDLAQGMESERNHLGAIAAALRQGLAAAGICFGSSVSQIVPILLGPNELALHVANVLQREGFVVRAIRPPTVPLGRARIRISLTSKISLQEVERLVGATARACPPLVQQIGSGNAYA